MANPGIANLYNIIMEQKVNACAKRMNERALGQASFRPKHSIVDRLVILRVIMEES